MSFLLAKSLHRKISFYKLILLLCFFYNCTITKANAVPSRNLTVFA